MTCATLNMLNRGNKLRDSQQPVKGDYSMNTVRLNRQFTKYNLIIMTKQCASPFMNT